MQNAQPQKELLRRAGDWGVPQQVASGKVDSQKHRLLHLQISICREKRKQGSPQTMWDKLNRKLIVYKSEFCFEGREKV